MKVPRFKKERNTEEGIKFYLDLAWSCRGKRIGKFLVETPAVWTFRDNDGKIKAFLWAEYVGQVLKANEAYKLRKIEEEMRKVAEESVRLFSVEEFLVSEEGLALLQSSEVFRKWAERVGEKEQNSKESLSGNSKKQDFQPDESTSMRPSGIEDGTSRWSRVNVESKPNDEKDFPSLRNYEIPF